MFFISSSYDEWRSFCFGGKAYKHVEISPWLDTLSTTVVYVILFYPLKKNMKKFKKIMPYVVVVALGLGMFYGMAHAQFGLNPGTQWLQGLGTESAGPNLISVIKTFLNWVLGLLSLIALVVLLYGGFNMVTAAGDEAKYKKGFKILQQAAVGLAIIGLSWIIVSFIFLIIGAGQSNSTSQLNG